MTKINIELPDELAGELERHAQSEGVRVPDYVVALIRRELHQSWPSGFFERVAGAWSGTPCERPPQGNLENRETL